MYTEEYYTQFRRLSSKTGLTFSKHIYIISFDKSHHTWLNDLVWRRAARASPLFPGCPESGSKCFTSANAVNVALGFYSPNWQTVLETFSLGTKKRATSWRTHCSSQVEVFLCEQRKLSDKIMCLKKGQANFWIWDICKLNIPSTAVSLT
jgi:hypothetical protein